MKLKQKDKIKLLKENIGKVVFSYHNGNNEIINTKTIIKITADNIKKISKRKQAYFEDDTLWLVRLWDETQYNNHQYNLSVGKK